MSCAVHWACEARRAALSAAWLACSAAFAQPSPGAEFPSVAARYRISVDTGWNAPGSAPRVQQWVFVREPGRVAVNKGDSEEIWQRQPHGGVTLQRVLHRQQRVIDYSAGELAALHVEVDWAALSRFVTPQPATRAEWDNELELPARIVQRINAHTQVQFELLESAATAPSDWVVPGSRSADYLHIDAADFGDMAYDPAVRAAEALDVQAGWRQHLHRR
jgi:hypothetical protein